MSNILGMTDTAVCSKCKRVIVHGNTGKVVEKVCINCVKGEAPAADMKKIVRPDGAPVKKMSERNIRKRMKTIRLEFNYDYIDNYIRTVFKIKDHFGDTFFSFALSEKQLEDHLHDMRTIEADAIKQEKEKQKK